MRFSREKSILFVTQKFVPVEVINKFLDDIPKEFSDDTKEFDGPIL